MDEEERKRIELESIISTINTVQSSTKSLEELKILEHKLQEELKLEQTDKAQSDKYLRQCQLLITTIGSLTQEFKE